MMMPHKCSGSKKAACLSVKESQSGSPEQLKPMYLSSLNSATNLQDNRGNKRKQLHRRVLRNETANCFFIQIIVFLFSCFSLLPLLFLSFLLPSSLNNGFMLCLQAYSVLFQPTTQCPSVSNGANENVNSPLHVQWQYIVAASGLESLNPAFY